ncbi:MAG: hypothetical protein WCK42_02445, partial [Myxococcaceae bacterium]
MKHLISLILIFLAACSNNQPQQPSSNLQNQEEPTKPTELTVEQKIALTKQCYPSYATQTERSVGYFEKIQTACLPDTKEQENVKTLIKSLRDNLKIFQPEILTPDNYYTYEPKFRSIVNEYQKLQNTLAYCRTQRVLEAQSPVPDDKLFLHAVGDVFGTGSGLEGHQHSITIPYRTQVLKQIQTQLEGQTYIADEIQSRPCYEPKFKVLPKGKSPRPDMSQTLLKKLVTQSQNAEDLMTAFERGDLNATRNLLIKQLGDLEKGESLFLPAGWTKHAVLYQFTKQPNEQVGFRIFNSGEGISTYHTTSIRGYTTQHFPFVEITDVAKDRITSFVFLKALQEIATPGVYKTTPQDFYEKLLTALDGKATQVKYDTSMFKDAQQSGTCSYFSTSWLLSSSVTQFSKTDSDQEAAAQIEFLTSLKTLKSFAGQRRDWNEEQLSLLRKGLVFVSESAARDYQNDFIDYGSLLVAANTGDGVKEIIIQADQKIEQAQAQSAAKFQASNLNKTKLPDLKRDLDTATEITAGSTYRQANSPIFNLDQDLNQLYTELEKAVLTTGYYNTRYDRTHAEAVLSAIEQLALVLPLKENFWSRKDPHKNIEALTKISKLYLFILLKQVQEKQRNPDKISAVSYLTSLKLLTVADLINQNLISQISPKIPSMYQPRAGLILSGKTSIFETSDPKWQEQIKFMREYYAPEKDQTESFFGFESYPSGIQGETRRFYDDPQAAEILEDKHWSLGRQYAWPDLKWVKNYITSNHINTGTWSSISPNIERFDYNCNSSYSCEPNGFTNNNYGPFLQVDRATKEILLNRKALLLLGDNSLPEVFYQLRQLSVISDFFLTGRFTTNPSGLNFDTGVRGWVSNSSKAMSRRVTNRYSCTCDDYHYNSYYDRDGNYQSTRIAPFHKQENARESTSFNQYNFNYSIFGISFETAKRQPIPKGEGFYVSPWVNLKDFNQPFVKFESAQGLIQKCTDIELNKCKNKDDAVCRDLRQNCKPVNSYHYTELLQIWSLGQNRALELLNPSISPLRYREEPNAYILKKTIDQTASGDTFARFSLERMRNLMGMNSQTELQLKATLDFFTKYPELYILPEYQVLFEKLMMEPALMQDQLRISEHDSELFIQSLKKFCDAKLELFKKFYDYKSIAFTLHMKQLFYQQALFAQVKPSTAQLLASAPEELFSVILELQPEQLTEKSFLYRNLAEMFLYSPQLTTREAELLLLAMIEFKAIPQQDLDFQDKFAEELIQNILVKQQENLKNAVNNQVLDFIAHHIRPGILRTSTNWTPKGAIYTAQFGTAEFQIDILNGQFYDAGNSRILFPIDAAKFKEVFGESVTAPSHAVRIGIDTYEWQDAKAQKNGVSWIFQKKINNTWYQYLDETDLKNLGNTKLVMSGYRYWRSINAAVTNFKIYSLDNQLAYEAEVSGSQIQNFKRLKDGAVLIDAASNSDYRVFGQIENWNQVYIWQDSNTQKVLEVELPRLHVIFKAVSNYIKCADHEDFKIAQKQYLTELGNPVNYLVCDLVTDPKNTQKKVILMPPSRLGPLLDPMTQQPIETLSTNKFETYFESNHLLTYEADPVLGLSRNSEASRYYLALRKLFKREYRQAAEEIRNTSIELKALETSAELKPGVALNPNELDIVNWLIKGNPIDSDPRSYAVRLLA